MKKTKLYKFVVDLFSRKKDLNLNLNHPTDSTKLHPEFKKKWVEMLRSGKFKQGSSRLYNPGTDSYCCLGVAAIACGFTKEQLRGKGYVTLEGTSEIYLESKSKYPTILLYGGGNQIPSQLANMNDGENAYWSGRLTFEQIADHIEQNL